MAQPLRLLLCRRKARNPAMSWTDDRIEMLKSHWEAGMTASQIAEALG